LTFRSDYDKKPNPQSCGHSTEKAIMANTSLRIDFFSAPKSLHPFLASLLTVGEVRSSVTLTGRVHEPNGRHAESTTVHLTVMSLGAEDGSGNNWLFRGFLEGGQSVKGYIRLSDGNGFIETV